MTYNFIPKFNQQKIYFGEKKYKFKNIKIKMLPNRKQTQQFIKDFSRLKNTRSL